MSVTTPTKAVRTLIAGNTSNAAGAATRGAQDLRTAHGGILTARITNGGTGPTVQGVVNVLIAHNAGATPAAGPQGADWKLLFSFGGGTTANAVTEQAIVIDASVMHLCVEVTGNTGQAVTCEAILSELTNFDTV
jgi:hypothetical protein